MELMGYPDGRQATRAQLRTRLATAPVRYIEGALENPEAGVEEVCLALRNRLATPEQIRRITRDRRFSDADAVRLGVLRHPNTPLSLARSLLGRLRPRELTDLTEDASLSPGLRHSAGQVLEQCCEELTLGERISLARRAPDGIVEALGRTGDAPVLIALLSNPRVREEHVERIAGSDKAPAEALRRLAEHPTWGRRPTVQCKDELPSQRT